MRDIICKNSYKNTVKIPKNQERNAPKNVRFYKKSSIIYYNFYEKEKSRIVMFNCG